MKTFVVTLKSDLKIKNIEADFISTNMTGCLVFNKYTGELRADNFSLGNIRVSEIVEILAPGLWIHVTSS